MSECCVQFHRVATTLLTHTLDAPSSRAAQSADIPFVRHHKKYGGARGAETVEETGGSSETGRPGRTIVFVRIEAQNKTHFMARANASHERNTRQAQARIDWPTNKHSKTHIILLHSAGLDLREKV